MRKILSILLFIFVLFGLFSCGKATGDFHTDLQNKYLNDNPKNATIYANGEEELSRPEAIKLTWDNKKDSYVVVIKEKETGKEISYTVDKNYLDLYNLKVHTSYEWYLDNEKKGEITTPEKLRNLYIDGLTNCRDIGGYKISDSYTNQGLLFRTSKLTDDYTGEALITEAGINELKRLGIKTELDLRRITDTDSGIEQGGITKSVIDGVNYISFPMDSSGNVLLLNRRLLKDLFAILGNEANYPILFHCSIGTDRTGLVAFLVNALLGVSEEDLYLDYCFSNFGLIHGSRNPSTIEDYIEKIKVYNDSEFSSTAVKDYLIGQGVKEEDINNLIRIMTK